MKLQGCLVSLGGLGLLLGLAGCGSRERVIGFASLPMPMPNPSPTPSPIPAPTPGPDASLEPDAGAGADAMPPMPTGDAGTTFSPPTLVTGLLDPGDEAQDPSLSPDETEIYFASIKNGTYDIWMSTRPAAAAPWNPAVVVPELSTSTNADYEPDLSSDSLTIFFSSDRAGAAPNARIWVSQRPTRSSPWGIPQLVNLAGRTIGRAPAVDLRGVYMVFASDRGTGDLDLYSATRDSPTAPPTTSWSVPVDIVEVNSPVFDWDPAVFNAGLGLVFGSRRNGDRTTSDLFETSRPSLTAPYAAPQPLDELNSAAAEGDPWLSDDGRHIVFSSERSGTSQLYEAWR